jgi:hypothetical protein
MKRMTQKHIVRNVSSVKNLGKMENFGINAQVVVFGHKLNVMGGNFQMVIFVMCV